MEQPDERTPTFAVRLADYAPDEVAQQLGEQGIFLIRVPFFQVGERLRERHRHMERSGDSQCH